MPERYRCFKEIDYMFKDLRGRIIEKNQKIKETAHWYIVNQAVYDLEKYRASLPSEAVYEICYCLKERAGLLEYKPDQYQWNEFLKDMRSAQMLYQENGLLADSALCALNIMDEGLAEFNIDSEYKPLYLDTIKISLQEVEKILPELMEHPVLNEIYLRLSMYCFSIDDIERSKHYYESFQRLGNFAIDHFAPWLRGRYCQIDSEVQKDLYTTPIIFDNYRLNSQVQICLENYLIGICSLESLYKKINIDILGVSKEEYKTIIDRIEQLNIEIVQTFRTIFSNIDFIMRFQEYCADKKRKQSKESGEKREFKRTKAVVDQFFRNVEHFCKDYIKKDFKAQLNCLILQDSKGKQVVFDISEVYGGFVQKRIEEFVSNLERQKEEQMRKLTERLNRQMVKIEPLQSVSTYLVNKSPKNAKKNIENLLHNIKCYYVRNENQRINYRFYDDIINYYQKIVEYELENPGMDLSDDLTEEYRLIVKEYSRYNEEK